MQVAGSEAPGPTRPNNNTQPPAGVCGRQMARMQPAKDLDQMQFGATWFEGMAAEAALHLLAVRPCGAFRTQVPPHVALGPQCLDASLQVPQPEQQRRAVLSGWPCSRWLHMYSCNIVFQEPTFT
jgi:hypothetical protein